MISLSLGHIVLACAAGPAALVLLLWIARNIARRRREAAGRRRCIQCMFCGTVYEDPSADALPACPQCAHPNERAAPPAV